jgi:hypothetical protein
VTSLLRGLKQFDTISALRKRLQHLPPGMEKLYQHMLASIDPLNMEESSKIFQINRAQLRTHSMGSVERVTLALTADLHRALTLDPETGVPPFGKSVLLRDEEMLLDVKLRTHCGGLLQIESGHNSVEFIHRTARDYLEKKDVWDGLLTHTNGSSGIGFDAYLALLIACVLNFKRDLAQDPRDIKDVYDYFFDASSYGKFVCPYNLHALILLLDEFDRAAMVAYRSEKPTKREFEFDPSTHWSALVYPVHWKTTFLSMASYETVNTYVETKLSPNTRLLEQGTGLPLLGFIFLSFKLNVFLIGTSETLDLLEILLAQGVDPNERYEGVAMWQYWVHYMHCSASFGKTGVETLPALKRIFISMLNRGVDLHVCCMMDSQIWENVYPEQEAKGINYTWDCSFTRRQLMDHGKRKDGIRDESPESSSEEIHSLSAVITDSFNTEQDPHGADELLEYIAMLKDQKKSISHGGASVGPKKKKKKNRKKGKNSGA